MILQQYIAEIGIEIIMFVLIFICSLMVWIALEEE